MPIKTPSADPRVTTLDRDLIIVANAGAGKTRLLVEHYFELLAQGFDPSAIVGFTFTEKAAFELRERILLGLTEHPAFGDLPSDLIRDLQLKIRRSHIGTIHQFCLRMIEEAAPAHQSQRHQVIDEAVEIQLRELNLNAELKRRFKAQDPDAILLLQTFGIARLRALLRGYLVQLDSVIDPDREALDFGAALAEEEALLSGLRRVAESLQGSIAREKARKHYLSFGDMERQALSLIRQAPALLQKKLSQFQHLLVDEFQDTSPVQIQILKALQEFHTARRGELRIFLVGDPKQSIYRFRQVDRRLIERTQDEVLKAGGLRFESVENYRSAPAILDFANAFSKGAFPDSAPSLAMLPENEGSRAALVPIACDEEKPNLARLRKCEARQVAEAVESSIAAGLAPERVAVLYRASAATLPLIQEFQERKIPFTVRGGQNLFERQEILDLKRLLYFLRDPNDDISLVGVLRSPLFLISDATLYFLARRKGSGSLHAYLQGRDLGPILKGHYDAEIDKLRWSVETLSRLLGQSQGLSAYAILRAVVSRFNFQTLYSLAYQSSDSLLHIEQWLDWLRNLEEENRIMTLGQSVQILKDLQESRLHKTPLADAIASQSGVQLMTMHAAKGLQFDTVFLIDLNRRPLSYGSPLIFWGEEAALKWTDETQDEAGPRYQKIKELHEEEEAEEEKRLLYVALTRAQNRLFVMFDPKNPVKGTLQSVLLENLGEGFRGYVSSSVEIRGPEALKARPQATEETPHRDGHRLVCEELKLEARQGPMDLEEVETFARCALQHHFIYPCQIEGAPDPEDRKRRIAQQALAFLRHRPERELRPWLRSLMAEIREPQDELILDAMAECVQSYARSPGYRNLAEAGEREDQLPYSLKTGYGTIRGQWDCLFRLRDEPWALAYFAYSSLSSKQRELRLKTQALAALRLLGQGSIVVQIHSLNRGTMETVEFSLPSLKRHEQELTAYLQAMRRPPLEAVKASEACEACRFNQDVPLCPVPRGLAWRRS